MPLELTPKQPPYYDIDTNNPTPQPQIAGLIVGYITQAGTNIPTATYAVNNTGATITFTRGGVGQYSITASAAIFTAGKTMPELGAPTGIITYINNSSTTQINFESLFAGAPADSSLTNTPFRITIYQ